MDLPLSGHAASVLAALLLPSDCAVSSDGVRGGPLDCMYCSVLERMLLLLASLSLQTAGCQRKRGKIFGSVSRR